MTDLIITGAPIEKLPFEDVTVLARNAGSILDWARQNVTSSLFICWGAQAALYHYYGVPKYPLNEKMFGVFEHNKLEPLNPIFRGFDDVFFVPHSQAYRGASRRYFEGSGIKVVVRIKRIGRVHGRLHGEGRELFLTGHSEYSPETLDIEYKRDLAKNLPIKMPVNYYQG
jgi:homoserine O-succinyltransferase